jgi:hypothetical protein
VGYQQTKTNFDEICRIKLQVQLLGRFGCGGERRRFEQRLKPLRVLGRNPQPVSSERKNAETMQHNLSPKIIQEVESAIPGFAEFCKKPPRNYS